MFERELTVGILKKIIPGDKKPSNKKCLHLTVVRPHLGYATQIWAPQTIELIKRVERVQRRATKFILNLPFYSEVPYEERLIASNLLPISFWHEYLDLVHFFKMINGLIYANKDILPARNLGNERKTRATSNPDLILFHTKKCKTVTYQTSFINRTTRIWNILPNELKRGRLYCKSASLRVASCESASCESASCESASCESASCESASCELRVCELRVCELRVCELRVCELRVASCESASCESASCESASCESASCELRVCELRVCELRVCELRVCECTVGIYCLENAHLSVILCALTIDLIFYTLTDLFILRNALVSLFRIFQILAGK